MLTVEDDPIDSALALNAQWRVTEKLSIKRIVDGKPIQWVFQCLPSAVCRNDFVNVQISFNIVVRHYRKGTKTVRAHLKLEQIL